MLLIALLGAYAASGECAARNAGNASGRSPMGTTLQCAARNAGNASGRSPMGTTPQCAARNGVNASGRSPMGTTLQSAARASAPEHRMPAESPRAARIGIPEGSRPARSFQYGVEQTLVFSVFQRHEQTRVSYAMPFSVLPAGLESPSQTEVAFVAMSAAGGSRSADFKTPVASARIVSRSALAAQLVAEVNAERAQRGLTRLSEDSDLTAAARIRAREIASVFSHTRPDGSSCFTVSEKAYGENIARGHGSVDRVMAAWMSSAGHRANILRASYGSIGVCCLQIDGVYCWVQLFGK